MTRILRKSLWLIALLFPLALLAAPAPVHDATTGVLVVAPDRGFLGNEEVRDAFQTFADGRNAALLLVTDDRSKQVMKKKLQTLDADGAKRIMVLPLTVSRADARWKLAHGWLEAQRQQGRKIIFARSYGQSYFASEDLSARLRDADANATRVLLVGYGADSTKDAATMRHEMTRVGLSASTLKADAVQAVIYPRRHAQNKETRLKAFNQTLANAHDTLVVPLAFASRHDGMMRFNRWFADKVPDDAELIDSPIATSAQMARWMTRAANTADLGIHPLKSSQVGVVVLAHGADWFWNRDIRQALAPLAAKHPVAYAFTMADQPVIEQAVHKLEKRNVRAIIIVRAFSMAESFRSRVERMIGAEVEGGASLAHAGSAHGMMMHHGDSPELAAKPRIHANVPVLTVGGVEDSALLAKALLTNAHSVSKDPKHETVILVAHGQGDDGTNQRWMDLLESLATQMREDGGDAFRAIRVATWREDWPDKRAEAVRHVRQMVHATEHDEGRALIVPVRINRQGAADRYLKGLDFGWSQGFAQTSYFAEWFAEQVQQGMRQLQDASSATANTNSEATIRTHANMSHAQP